jgi:hypothetical protein
MATATRPRTLLGIVLEDVSWADYEAQLRIIGDRHIRVNYDSGRMEIMSPLRRHGNGGYLLGWNRTGSFTSGRMHWRSRRIASSTSPSIRPPTW